MSWVLIILVTRFGGLYGSSPAATVAAIPGYQTKEECETAAKAILQWEVKPTATCIPAPSLPH